MTKFATFLRQSKPRLFKRVSIFRNYVTIFRTVLINDYVTFNLDFGGLNSAKIGSFSFAL